MSHTVQQDNVRVGYRIYVLVSMHVPIQIHVHLFIHISFQYIFENFSHL